MKNMVVTYGTLLRYQGLLEREIEHLAQEYRELCWKHTDTLKAANGDKFSKDYGVDNEYFKEKSFCLRVKQFETFKELMNLMKDYYEQTGDKLPRKIHMMRELINFNPGYDDFDNELNKMREQRGW